MHHSYWVVTVFFSQVPCASLVISSLAYPVARYTYMVGSKRERKIQGIGVDKTYTGSQTKRRDTHENDPTKPEVPVKRRRVTRACDQCRQGREKCDGAQPCQTCRGAERHCSYIGISKRRGVQPGYIRALEVLLAWTLTNIDGVDSQLQDLLAREPVTEELGLSSKDTTISDTLSGSWASSQVHRDLEVVLNGNLSKNPAIAKGGAGQLDISFETAKLHDNMILERKDQADEDVEMVTTIPMSLPDGSSQDEYGTYSPLAGAQPFNPHDKGILRRAEISGASIMPRSDPLPTMPEQTYMLNLQPRAQNTSTASTHLPLHVNPGLRGTMEFDAVSSQPSSQPFETETQYPNLDFFSDQTQQYSYNAMEDLNAFLDDLGSTEFANTSIQEPQFMQNLGFGPDFNPSELLNEAGEWIVP